MLDLPLPGWPPKHPTDAGDVLLKASPLMSMIAGGFLKPDATRRWVGRFGAFEEFLFGIKSPF